MGMPEHHRRGAGCDSVGGGASCATSARRSFAGTSRAIGGGGDESSGIHLERRHPGRYDDVALGIYQNPWRRRHQVVPRALPRRLSP